MNTREFTRCLACTLLTLAVSWPDLATAQSGSWQRNWKDFVESFNTCITQKSCDPASRFYGKVVTWEGSVEKLEDVVSVDMGPLRLKDRQGRAGDSVTVLLFPVKGKGSSWSRATPGSTIAFKGKLPAKGSELTAVELNSMGSKNFAFVQLVDAELLTRPVPAR